MCTYNFNSLIPALWEENWQSCMYKVDELNSQHSTLEGILFFSRTNFFSIQPLTFTTYLSWGQSQLRPKKNPENQNRPSWIILFFPPMFEPKSTRLCTSCLCSSSSQNSLFELLSTAAPPPLPQCGRESISAHFQLPAALIDVDTESTPLADPGSPALQMSSDVLSAAAAEIRRDSGDAACSAESGPRLGTTVGGIAVVTELAKSRLSRSEPTSLHFQLPTCCWRPNRDA